MPPKKYGLVSPNSRDIDLFRYLFENKVASFSQIHRDIFKEVTKQATSQRLKTLKMAGFLEKSGFSPIWGLIHVYNLSNKGIKVCVGKDMSEVPVEVRKSYAFGHDMELVDIRKRLSGYGSVNRYMTENFLLHRRECSADLELDHYRDIRSDAVCELRNKNGLAYVPLEYEVNIKGSLRYEEKLGEYYARSETQGLLFIAKNRQILNSVQRVDDLLYSKFGSKIYYALLDEFHQSSKEVTFKNLRNDIFKIGKVYAG